MNHTSFDVNKNLICIFCNRVEQYSSIMAQKLNYLFASTIPSSEFTSLDSQIVFSFNFNILLVFLPAQQQLYVLLLLTLQDVLRLYTPLCLCVM